MSSVLEIQTFGGLVLRVDEQIIKTGVHVKARAMLAYIARQTSPQPREKLAGLFWSDFPAERVAQNLRLALLPLREHLSDYVVITPVDIAVNAWLDASAFDRTLDTLRPLIAGRQPFTAPDIERFAEAMALYRGDFLAHLDLQDASAFDEWASVEREALRQRFIVAGSPLLEAFRATRRYAEGIDLALRLLSADSLHEETHRHLMRLYAVSGDRTSALQQFERLQTSLWDELGVEPDDETITLYERIAANEVEVLSDDVVLVDGKALPPSNLPGEMSPFLGRASELEQIADLLTTARCVTLVGTGGIGKTRLALKTAERQRTVFSDGVYWVELAPVVSANAVAEAVRSALNIEDTGAGSLSDALAAYLREKHLLLVLDNFEHVLDAAELVEQLLRSAPEIRMLLTSREPLRLYGEYAYDVPTLTRAEAAELFVDRARAIQPRFQADDLTMVDALCARLDDLPLALELAASGARSQSLAKILARLDASSLSSPLRGISERQRTLFNTIEWSFQLLTMNEQALYRRLAYFVGTWTEEATAAVSGGAEGLEALVEKSLLRRSEDERYSMLETIRQHARMKLSEHGEDVATLQAYLDYYAEFAETANIGLRGRDEALWTKRLQSNLDNLHAALEYASESSVSITARLVAALGRFWYMVTLHREARIYGEWALRHRDDLPPDVLAGVLAALGHSAFLRAERQQAEAYHREALALYEAAGDLHGQAYMNMCMGAHATHVKDSVRYSQKAYDLFQTVDEISLFTSICNNLGVAYLCLADNEAAETVTREGLARMQGTSMWAEGPLLHLMVDILREQGQFSAALDTAQQCFHINMRKSEFDINSFMEQGETLLMMGLVDEAEACYDSAMELLQRTGLQFSYRTLQNLGGTIADARNEQAAMKERYTAALSDLAFDTVNFDELFALTAGLAHLVWCLAREGWLDEAHRLRAGLEQEFQRRAFGLNRMHRLYLDKAAPLLADVPSLAADMIPDNPYAYALECLARLEKA